MLTLKKKKSLSIWNSNLTGHQYFIWQPYLDQDGGRGGGEKQTDSRYIVKVELSGLADVRGRGEGQPASWLQCQGSGVICWDRKHLVGVAEKQVGREDLELKKRCQRSCLNGVRVKVMLTRICSCEPRWGRLQEKPKLALVCCFLSRQARKSALGVSESKQEWEPPNHGHLH